MITADEAIGFGEGVGFSFNEWQCNVIRSIYDTGPSSPYTIAGAPFRPANKFGQQANKLPNAVNAQFSRGIASSAAHRRSSEVVPTATPWGGTPTCVDGSPKGP